MPETEFPVPASEAEVTKEWLQAALASSFPDATFTSLDSERIGEAYGFASRIFRYQWQDYGTPQTVVIKLWNTDSKAGLENLDAVIEYYLDEFNQVAGTSLNRKILEKQLGGILLQKFELSTCGIALWQPSMPRAIEMIDRGIENVSRLVEFWQDRDPELSSFLR